MRLSSWLPRAGAAALVVASVVASVAVGTVPPAAAGPQASATPEPIGGTREAPWVTAPASGKVVVGRTDHVAAPARPESRRRTNLSARSGSTSLFMPGWPDDLHNQFGVSFLGRTGVMATHSVNPSGSFSSTDFLWAPTLYPGGVSCIEVLTSYHSDGRVHVHPQDWCGGGFQPGFVVDAAFRDKYVRSGGYTIKIELTNAGTNEWTAYLYNHNTSAWDTLYTKAGIHGGDPSGGWDIFEIYTYYNPDTTVGDYCDRTASYSFSSNYLYFKENNVWTAATASNTSRYDDNDPASYGCPGLTLQWSADTAYTVTNAPLGCSVHPVIDSSGANFTLAVQLFNPNAYHINGWTLKIALTGSQTVTSAVNAGFSQSGNIVTVTNGTTNSTIASSGGVVTFALQGTYTGANTNPTIFLLDTGYTPNTCTLV